MSKSPADEEAPTYSDKTSPKAMQEYAKLYQESIADPAKFWSEKASELLDWFVPFNPNHPMTGSLSRGDITWFAGGKLNICYNAVDRHVFGGRADDIAMIAEGDEPTDIRRLTYQDLFCKVSQIANALKSQGVRKGDVVTIYMPMIPELPMTMLACARIGAVHSVVFAGFSSEALAHRICDARSRYIVTADQGVRGSRMIPVKHIVNDAMTKLDCPGIVEKVMVWERFYVPTDEDGEPLEAPYHMYPQDVRMDPLVAAQRPYCVPETMDAEDDLFILYTSGSTGKPKGLLHTTAGYALFAQLTTKVTFDIQPGDILACVADCGWITGHSYVVYGPLLNGATTFVFESTPVYPDPGRYWDLVQRHRITQFYTAPTAIRLLMRYGDDIPANYDTSSLRILGTVGEPINAEAWKWYYHIVGKEKCTIVDTYWQTETGGHVITNIPNATAMKPASCALPFLGIDAVVLDPIQGTVLSGATQGVLAFRKPWPGMARTCLSDHERYVSTYLQPYPGYHFSGDSVYRDNDGFYFVKGRVDDVLNVSGHRIGNAEIEAALQADPAVAQAAVVGKPHPIKGSSICAFCMLAVGYEETPQLVSQLRLSVRTEIGGFAAPDMVCITPNLPMTRSGKIMRRILRKIVAGEANDLGDVSTLSDPRVINTIIEIVAKNQEAGRAHVRSISSP